MNEIPNTIGSWQGLTIKEILEKVDLSNIINEDMDKNKEEKLNDPMLTSGAINPESAFLGPKLWSKPVQMPMTNDSDEEFAVMNIDDFLNENGFDLEEQSNNDVQSPQSSISSNDMDTEEQDHEPPSKKSKKKIDTTFLYVESKRARMEREKEEKKRKSVIDMEFSARDLALATVPGMEFDPRERAFNVEELKPQPIIRKRKKVCIFHTFEMHIFSVKIQISEFAVYGNHEKKVSFSKSYFFRIMFHLSPRTFVTGKNVTRTMKLLVVAAKLAA